MPDEMKGSAPSTTGSPASAPAAAPARAKLGNLAEEQHKKHLRGAKIAIFFVGILSTLVNGFLVWLVMQSEAKMEADITQAKNNPAMVLDEAKITEARGQIATAKLLTSGFLGAGILILVLGFMVNKYPYEAPLAALVLYIACMLIGFAVEPEGIARGIIIKAIIIYALYRGVKSGAAVKKLREEAALQNASF
jgi:F0F1-type ATP synthase assembly protein I